MRTIFRWILLSAFAVSLSAPAASLLDLGLNFRAGNWTEFLTRVCGKTASRVVDDGSGGMMLEIPAGTSWETQKFRYFQGTIQAAVEASTTEITPGVRPYQVGWITLVFYDSNGKEIGHHDLLNTGKATDWQTCALAVANPRQDTAWFRLSLRNAGTGGVLRVRSLSLRIDVPDGEALCGDPGFRGDFGVDHWNYVREGADWDRLALKGPTGEAKYVAGLFSDGGKSLLIRNDATFRSNRYPYDGESLLFGGWAGYRGRTRGKTEWAWANLQLVLFDREGRVIGHSDLTPLAKIGRAHV